MSLVEQFEKHRNEMRPCEPYSESENPEQWARVLAWQEGYTDWLENKIQNTSSNSDYAKCSGAGKCDYDGSECDENNNCGEYQL